MDLKKPTTFQEQVNLLVRKNIIVTDVQACELFLSQVNYYRISAYFLPFLDKSTELCFDGINFERIQQIYYFDQSLRALIFEMIEDIEIHIRTKIAYYHAHKYGSDGYMISTNYNKRHNHDDFLKRISNCIYENRKTLVVQHHNEKYDGRFPLWVMIEFFSIGMLSHFYRSFVTQDQKIIAKELYGVTPEILQSWMRCITDLRNKCAHYSRIYYWVFPATPKMPKGITYVPTRRLFAQLYMLKLMYPDSSKWNDYYLKSLIRLTRKYKSYISLKHLDFPYRWKSMLKN
ncbi:MAG: Abi family protein [Lachnospiraceae bacterium]|nr:Abi family protein [Lachnospiraceae bacterium]